MNLLSLNSFISILSVLSLMLGRRSLAAVGFQQVSSVGRWKYKNRNFSTVQSASSGIPPHSRIERLIEALKLSNTTVSALDLDNLSNNTVIQHILSLFSNGRGVSQEYVDTLLEISTGMMSEYPNIVTVERASEEGRKVGNVIVCGDTHGQFDDFCEIFTNKVGGFPSSTNRFVFNGDIADRGPKAVEIFTTLLTMKVMNPDAIHILRGNHESEEMTNSFGFKTEVLQKYGKKTFSSFQTFFRTLPIAATLEDAAFIVHGGLGPNSYDMTLAQINEANRLLEPGYEGDKIVSELLWADPSDKISGFSRNVERGGGFCFGSNVTSHFLVKNNLSLLIRSHEVRDYGFSVHHENRCVTVFSAPNYCGVCGNLGAVLKFCDGDNGLHVVPIKFGPKFPPKPAKPSNPAQ